MNPPDLNELTKLTTQQKAGNQGLLAGQNELSSDFLKRYTGFLGSQEGTGAMYQRIGDELGIPQLRQNALTLRNTLTNLPTTYSKATTGYDVNANQLSRIIGTKAGELAPAVETSERALASAEGVQGQRMGFEQADRERALLPFQTERELMSDRFARETTLYSQENQNELNALIAKIQSGITLSEGEKNRANQLALAEKSYEQAKLTADKPNTQIIEQGGKKYLIDSATGKIISTYGSGSTPKPASYYFGNAVQTNPNNPTSMMSVPSYFTPIK